MRPKKTTVTNATTETAIEMVSFEQSYRRFQFRWLFSLPQNIPPSTETMEPTAVRANFDPSTFNLNLFFKTDKERIACNLFSHQCTNGKHCFDHVILSQPFCPSQTTIADESTPEPAVIH